MKAADLISANELTLIINAYKNNFSSINSDKEEEFLKGAHKAFNIALAVINNLKGMIEIREQNKALQAIIETIK